MTDIDLLRHTDIYLIDQIFKGRYIPGQHILDAGCGSGRNLPWFVQQGFAVTAIDTNVEALQQLQEFLPALHVSNIHVCGIRQMPFTPDSFDHIICSAVLHFAQSDNDFIEMMTALHRVLKPSGTLFIRMASNFGMENVLPATASQPMLMPDGSMRYVLQQSMLDTILQQTYFQLAEPVKSTLVLGQRSMATLLLQKRTST